MGRFGVGKIRWGVMLLVAAAMGLPATANLAGASGGCSSAKCALGSLSYNPSPVGAGATVNFTFTLTNEDTQQSLGSADLTAPSNWVLSSASVTDGYPAASATANIASGTVLELRSLDVPPGGAITASFTGTVSCAGAASDWMLQAKQANNFNGNPGNDFVIDSASGLSVQVSGECTLAFVSIAEPAKTSFPTGGGTYSNDITSQPFDPTGAPVEVEAKDGEGNLLGGVTIALSEIYGPTNSKLIGDTSATTGDGTGGTSLGVASFSPIYVNQTGYYALTASAAGFHTTNSTTFLVTTTSADCNSSCAGDIAAGNKTTGVSVDISNATGGDILSLGLGGFAYSCTGYGTVTGSIGVDLWTASSKYDGTDSAATYDIIIDVPKSEVDASANNGAPFYQICYASTEDFPVRAGGMASQDTDTTTIPGTLTPLYVGLLPDCSSTVPAPCTVSRTKKGGDVLIEFFGAPGDFWGST